METAKENIGASRPEFRVAIDITKRIIMGIISCRSLKPKFMPVDISGENPV